MDQVSAWAEKIIIPTYAPCKAEKNPIFLDKRVYQGSSGIVYPHPVVEKIEEVKTNKEYTAVFIENKYLRIMVLPELGGRIQRAYDKIRNRDFVYYNQVIKPALVGLTGPWISGGIEFNWPQHHRPSTFDPVDFTIEENEDGSKTIWVNELEIMTRTRGMAGFTLYPDKAYLEIKGKVFNRTPFPQTFLWWANPAVKVNEHYQSVFPPDVHAVYDHGKRDVSSFPIATGTYYKVDYSPGTDISKYKNIPVPTSFMAAESKYDFIGGYENDSQAGMLHVADHHFSPGKKQWTWGSGDFGQAWDRNLTDEDGPYIELMCGVYTDNQPDFSWLQPNEEKTFEQYFMPYSAIGIVKNATKEAAINVLHHGKEIEVKIYVTAEYENAQLEIYNGNKIIYEETVTVSPAKFYDKKIIIEPGTPGESISLRFFDADGNMLVNYEPEPKQQKPIPPPAVAALEPHDIKTTEQLYLNGLHLEQYRHATFNPRDYYEEALRRDPSDIRNNNALGLWLMRKGQPGKAEKYFRAAIQSQTTRNPNPYDGEPMYNLGICLEMMSRNDEAYECFYKSTWNDAWQHSAYLQLARLASAKKDYKKALYLVKKSLLRNYNSASARHLQTAILRKLDKTEEAVKFALCSLKIDPFNFGCSLELELLQSQKRSRSSATRRTFNNYAEYALDYAKAGLYEEALRLLKRFESEQNNNAVNPLCYYYTGWLFMQLKDTASAKIYFDKGASAPADYCFPSKTEDVRILKTAIEINPSDAKAYYYLGNYWYAHNNPAEAISCWEKSSHLDDRFPTVFRNLSLAYYNKLQDKNKSLAAMEKAFRLDTKDARVLMELDQLYKRLNYCHWERLQALEYHVQLTEQRHDLYLERVTLYNQIGDFETADALIKEWKFQPWEGGEGKVVAQYIICQVELAKAALLNNDPQKALAILDATGTFPLNLGEGKLPNVPENDIHYWKGIAYQQMGQAVEAANEFLLATKGNHEPAQAVFYNDTPAEQIFFKAKALQHLGESLKAEEIFIKLINFGQDHLKDKIKIKMDYFAVSLPDLLVFDQDLNLRNEIHCNYLIGLGYLGLGKKELANKYFNEVLKKDINHQGASILQHSAFL